METIPAGTPWAALWEKLYIPDVIYSYKGRRFCFSEGDDRRWSFRYGGKTEHGLLFSDLLYRLRQA